MSSRLILPSVAYSLTLDKNTSHQRTGVVIPHPVRCRTSKASTASRVKSSHPPVVSQFGEEELRVGVVLLGDVDVPGPHGDIRELDDGRHGLESVHELLHLRGSDVVHNPRPGRLKITQSRSVRQGERQQPARDRGIRQNGLKH